MTQTITVEGMSCGGCEQNVEDALGEVEGVTSAKADHEGNRVTVEGDASTEDIVAAVEAAGYTPQA